MSRAASAVTSFDPLYSMRVKLIISSLLVGSVAFAAAARELAAQDMGIEVGKIAPAVTVQTLEGKPLDLGRYIGKGPMLVEFWATWCPNCRELMPILLASEKKYGSRVRFLAVAVNINQSPERVRRFLAVHPLPHETVFDATGSAAEGFDAPATSYVVILDRKGAVVYTGLGGKQDLDAALAKLF